MGNRPRFAQTLMVFPVTPAAAAMTAVVVVFATDSTVKSNALAFSIHRRGSLQVRWKCAGVPLELDIDAPAPAVVSLFECAYPAASISPRFERPLKERQSMQIVLSSCNLAEAERVLILVALAEMGDIEGAAELCGVSWSRLQRLLRVHDIDWPGALPRRPRTPRPRST